MVVGAGPGGLHAAKILAENKKDVLVLEKNGSVREKVCAGGITYWGRRMNIIPEECFEKEFYDIVWRGPKKQAKMKHPYPATITYNRNKFGEFQRKRAEEAGGEVRLNARVLRVNPEKNSVEVDEKDKGRHEIGYKYLVGADGSTSTVRKSLKQESDSPVYYMCYQYRCPDELEIMEWGFDSTRFGIGGYWIFPHKNYTLIGYGYLPQKYGGLQAMNKKEFLVYWEERGVNLDPASCEAAPIEVKHKGFRFGNIYLIGDAGGFAYPLSGEGVPQAFKTAEIAANSILNKNYNYEKGLSKLLRAKKLSDVLLGSVCKINKLFPRTGKKLLNSGLDAFVTMMGSKRMRKLYTPLLKL